MFVPSEDIIMIKCIFICAILIWAFGVSSHTQSHEVREVKINGVVRQKTMFCTEWTK